MQFFPNRTTFLQIGNLTVQWYAVFIVSGAFLAYLFSKRNLKEYKNIDVNDFFDDVFITILWSAVVGARLWFCIFNNFAYYSKHPLDVIRIWDGGLAFHGGFILACISLIVLCKKRNVSFIKLADSVAPTVLLGQAIGRWGNFVNKECHGAMVDASYFDGILKPLKEGMCINGSYYVPLFFYESMACLTGFIIINFFLRKTSKRRGELTGAYLMWYGVARFFIEAGRTDSLYIGPLKTAQLTSVAFVLAGLALYLGAYEKVFKRKKPTVVFDLDGTLQDSTPGIIAGFKAVHEKYGNVEDFTPQRQIEVLGPPLQDMMMKYFPNEDPEELCKYYRIKCDEAFETTLKPMPNAVETVRTLKELGYQTAILTTRMTDSTMKCLKICGFEEDDFDIILGVDRINKTKPDPDGLFQIVKKYGLNGDDILMVGDSTADVLAGQRFGAYTVAYLVLEEKKQKILDLKPNRVITDIAEVLDIVKEDHYFTYNLK
ncbi:MAG: prolipoprotein diacylglyceryl transferase [Erysipelotrichaceae bacterium]|nr:prolipoprotein diacylglyceryl transferase [Erysipelotrichaceae bacterium]